MYEKDTRRTDVVQRLIRLLYGVSHNNQTVKRGPYYNALLFGVFTLGKNEFTCYTWRHTEMLCSCSIH